MASDLDALLADLKRQQTDLDKGLSATPIRAANAAELAERLRKLRERAERTPGIGPDDDTVRVR